MSRLVPNWDQVHPVLLCDLEMALGWRSATICFDMVFSKCCNNGPKRAIKWLTVGHA